MVPVLCINDKEIPKKIPAHKRVVQDEVYHVTFVVRMHLQKVLAFELYEKPLGPDCKPYEYWVSTRFAVKSEDVQKLIDMYTEVVSDDMMKELLENSNLEVIETNAKD